jgi:hypothetical protein
VQDRDSYGLLAVDLNVFVSCEKHVEDHGCKAGGIRLTDGCMEAIADALNRAIYVSDFYKMNACLMVMNSYSRASLRNKCVDTFEQLVEELVDALYERATASTVALAQSLEKLMHVKCIVDTPKVNSLPQKYSLMLKRFLKTVKQCSSKDKAVTKDIPNTIKCHSIMRLARCILKNKNTRYAPAIIDVICCMRRDKIAGSECRELCSLNSIVIVHCAKR